MWATLRHQERSLWTSIAAPITFSDISFSSIFYVFSAVLRVLRALRWILTIDSIIIVFVQQSLLRAEHLANRDRQPAGIAIEKQEIIPARNTLKTCWLSISWFSELLSFLFCNLLNSCRFCNLFKNGFAFYPFTWDWDLN